MKHLILGAGPAGVIAAETIRKHAPKDSVVLVGDEPEAPYSRMAIPYLLIGNIKEEGTHLRHSAGHFARLGIQLQQGRAAQVNVAKREVSLASGDVHSFDRLLIATGSTPSRPPVPGLDGPGVHSCWTLADARAIQKLAKPGARVVQMGAGFIGCIIMEALAACGVKLSVVETGDRMVPRMMGAIAGGMIKDWCGKKGVDVHTGASVARIERPAGGAMKVHLSNGKVLDADLVITATGVKPNIGFLAGSGVRCLQGVLTDHHMQSTAAGIYAAGDCAEAYDQLTGTTVVSAIQPNAAEQARVAALNMVGQRATLAQVTQINVIDTLGLVSTSFGKWYGVPGGQVSQLTDMNGNRHLSLQFSGDQLVGCNSVGWADHVGVMRGLVEGRVSLGPWKEALMKDPTQLMKAYLARAQAQDTHALVKG
jgi:NADPH-dependent 2,4-dienoyl-CoA reductase/sulfur reductase-like enzyme